MKWFVDESLSQQARALRDEYVARRVTLLAPGLLEYEVANALRYHPLVRLTDLEVTEAITTLRAYAIMVSPTMTAWRKALELSRTYDISIYDSLYLANATTAGAVCVTADEELVRALGAEAEKLALHLGNFPFEIHKP